MVDGFMCKSPGNEINTSAVYRMPFGQVFVRGVSTGAIGMAEGALKVYRDRAASRVAAGDGAKVAEDPNAQMVAAQAASLVDEARTVLHHNMGHLMSLVRAGETNPLDLRIRYRYDSSNATVKCVEAIDLLFTASGGRAIFEQDPLLRYFLDVHAARAHYANNPNKPGWNYGSTQLGLKNKDFFL